MGDSSDELQKLEDEIAKTKEALKKEEQARKEVENLNNKLLEEKQNLLASLEGEKGEYGRVQEKANKLQAQKTDLEMQLSVSKILHFFSCLKKIIYQPR